MTLPKTPIGVILAGGLSSRMQGPEKTLMPLAGKPMIAHLHERLASQVEEIIINANGDPARFDFLQTRIQPDTIRDNPGPLAGILAGMRWAEKNRPQATHILTIAGDTPFFPRNLLLRLTEALSGEDDTAIALAYSNGNRHPTFGLWPVSLADSLEEFLMDGDRKVMLFAQRYHLQKVDFPLAVENGKTYDPFFNINTPDDLAEAEVLIAEGSQ